MIFSAATTLLGGIFGWNYFGHPEETLMMTINGAIVGLMLDVSIMLSGFVMAKGYSPMLIMSSM